MKEIVVTKTDAGQRLDKYLVKLLPNAGRGFVYKMLRKKNITLNGNKSDGSDKVNAGDIIKLFLSDETYDKMSRCSDITDKSQNKSDMRIENATCINSGIHTKNKISGLGADKLDILYEDDNIIAVNKPSGILSQKSSPSDVSINEIICEYLRPVTSGSTFKPGVCNRLDRNTSGIIVAGKNMYGTQTMSECFRSRTIGKYYICIIKGKLYERIRLSGYISKDEASNKVDIIDEGKYEKLSCEARLSYQPIETEFMPAAIGRGVSLVKVHLFTGKTHQIRAHLKSIGCPIAGDYKYGDESFNTYMKNKYRIGSQMLHAYELIVPEDVYDKPLRITTPIPSEFMEVLKGENIWQPGIPEALEGLH